MSWFSVGIPAINAYKEHNSWGELINGEFVSGFVFNRAIKHNKINLHIREAVSNKFCSLAAPKVLPASRPIAEKALQKTLNPEKLSFFKQRLLEKYAQSSSKDLARVGKEVLRLGLRQVTSRVFKSKPKETTEQSCTTITINEQNKTYHQDILKSLKERKFSEAALIYMESKLMPVCEEAVQKALLSMTKGVAEKAYDIAIKKTCSLVVMPLMYSTFLLAVESMSFYSPIPMETYTDYFPHPVTVLTVSAGIKAIQLIKCIWDESRKHAGTVDLDKDEVKKLAFGHARAGMSKKIKENELLTNLEMNQTEEDVDNIIKTFISEMVDFYWQDLHETKILRLPLVA